VVKHVPNAPDRPCCDGVEWPSARSVCIPFSKLCCPCPLPLKSSAQCRYFSSLFPARTNAVKKTNQAGMSHSDGRSERSRLERLRLSISLAVEIFHLLPIAHEAHLFPGHPGGRRKPEHGGFLCCVVLVVFCPAGGGLALNPGQVSPLPRLVIVFESEA